MVHSVHTIKTGGCGRINLSLSTRAPSKVRGPLHTMAALPQGKEMPALIGLGVGCEPQPFWMR
jgi:hypothetical protein